ncbi:MAG: protein kinase [Planctomycetales bacterium]|nr:protein kinase [Planctomycetales bacterium]
MNRQHQPNPVSINVFELIDELCDDFRRHWKESQRRKEPQPPRIEDYLERVPVQAQATLFKNILLLEIRYRQRVNENPSSKDYLARFPKFRRLIGDAFLESTSLSTDALHSTQASEAGNLTVTVDGPAANRIGDYELIRELGRGGFGVVYEAKHIKRQNCVALKTLPTGNDGQEVNAERIYKFRREFRSLSEFNHPNLVGMQTLEVDGSQWFFTMDLIRGVDFLSYVRPEGTLDESRLRSALKQLAGGIIALHEQQILHRDLKPSNVMVSDDGRVAILDFGLVAELEVRTDETASAHSRHFAGTPRYSAPEQVLGNRSSATDWYTLGTMLYEALTGEVPFNGTNTEVLIRKQTDDAPTLSGRSGLPSDLTELTDALLQRNPRDRPDTEAIAMTLRVEFDSTSHGSSDLQSDGTIDSLSENRSASLLIGRDQQLAELTRIKTELLTQRAPLAVWLTGLSGEGKSTLADSFLGPLRRGQEVLVLSGRCYDREMVPFKVIDSQIDSLVKYLRAQSEPFIEEVLPQDIEKLAQLFPGLRRVESIERAYLSATKRLEVQKLRDLAFSALKDLLRAIAMKTPIVMFVDDLQWGDRDSADVLFQLLAPPLPPAVMLLGTFRSDEMSESPFLDQWNRSSPQPVHPITAHQITVGPLSMAECQSFLQRRFEGTYRFSDEEVEELYANCKGNPYFLEHLIEGFDPESGEIRARSLSVIIQSRLSRCPDGAAELLNAIAVGGKAVLPQEAAAVAGFGVSGLATLTHMRNERLVRLVEAQQEQLVDTYHDKIRETSLNSMDQDSLKQLHIKYGETIEKNTVDVDKTEDQQTGSSIHPRAFDLAHHYEEGEDPRAFQYLMQAGQAALDTYAMDAAAEYLFRAKRHRPDSLSRDTEFKLEMMLGRALFGSNDVESSASHIQKAADLATAALDKADAYYLLAEAHWRLGEYEVSLGYFQQAFKAIGEKLSRSKLGNCVKTNLALMRFHLIPYEFPLTSPESTRYASVASSMYAKYSHKSAQFELFAMTFAVARACVLARKSRDPNAKRFAYDAYAHIAAISGLWRLAHFMNKRAELHGSNTSTEIDAHAVYQRGCLFYFQGCIDDGLRCLSEADFLFSRSGDWQLSMAVHFQRHSWSVKGNVFEILKCANREIDIARQSGDAIVSAWGLYGRADGLSRSGNFSAALRDVVESIKILEEANATTTQPIAYLERGRVELQASDYGAARQSLVHSIKLIIGLRFFEVTVDAFALYVEAVLGAEWRSSTHGVASAKQHRYASRASLVARFSGWLFPNSRPHAHRVTGRLLASKGRHSRAIKSFDKAVASAKTIGADYEHARSLIDKSMLEYQDAKVDRQRGLELLESLGCVLPKAEAEYLEIDWDTHYARAANAREAADKSS